MAVIASYDETFEPVQRGVKKIELENDDGYQ